MSKKTKIQWTERTWNPFRGCTRVSEGCRFCYAEAISARFSGKGQPYEGLAKFVYTDDGQEARWTNKVKVVQNQIDEPLHWTKPSLVFVNSMSDVFHDGFSDDDILYIFDIMARAYKHDFQILTKRPLRLLELNDKIQWTPNIWMGVSVEDNKTLERVEQLSGCDAKIKFLSIEPLLEDIATELDPLLKFCDWVIVGGESGYNARKMKQDWAYNIYHYCRFQDVPFFFKQWGGKDKDKGGSVFKVGAGDIYENQYPKLYMERLNESKTETLF